MISIGQVPFVTSSNVTVKFASVEQLSDIAGFPVNPSIPATVVSAAGASAEEQPSIVTSVILPVIVGTIVSLMLIICAMVDKFPASSVIVYVLVITIGQVPFATSLEVTVKLASVEQLSDIAGFPAKASIPATVVSAAGASAIVHPSIVLVVILPVIDGGVVSLTVILSLKSSPFVEGSLWSASAVEVVFVIVLQSWPTSTIPLNCKVALEPSFIVPIVHSPVPELYVPWLGLSEL